MLAVLSGCGTNSGDSPGTPTSPKAGTASYLNEQAFPITKEPITLKVFVASTGNQVDYNKMLLWQEYEKKTGIRIEWIQAPANAADKRNLLLASNDLPDIILKDNIDIITQADYGSQGVFVKLNDLIDKYGPNVKKALDKYPDVKKGLSMPDGSIYSLGYIDDGSSTKIGNKLFINQKWLDNVGMKMPETTDDFYKVLKAFKEKDPNKNGLADEVPFSVPYGIGDLNLFLAGSFGLLNKGLANPDFDLDDNTNKLRFIYTQSGYRDMLEYLNKLYTEKLLDNEIFTLKSTQFTAKSEQGLIGAANAPHTTAFGQKHGGEYYGVPTVLKGPKGYQYMSIARSSLRNVGNFIITKANKYPEASMRWVDFFYSEEGIKQYFMGFEGKTYNVVNGEYVYTDEIQKNPNGFTLDQAVGQYLPYGGGNNPTIITDKYYKGGDNEPRTLQVVEQLKKSFPKDVWAPFSYKKEESEAIVAIRTDIRNYVAEMRAQFVTGKAPLSQWDTYVATLQKMGVDEYLKVSQVAYERYANTK
ncbi:MAG: transporter substrate-binding protein [Paenibacillus sp.]|nr:transporter substrate-binding protein [Paenibacillus sp.]